MNNPEIATIAKSAGLKVSRFELSFGAVCSHWHEPFWHTVLQSELFEHRAVKRSATRLPCKLWEQFEFSHVQSFPTHRSSQSESSPQRPGQNPWRNTQVLLQHFRHSWQSSFDWHVCRNFVLVPESVSKISQKIIIIFIAYDVQVLRDPFVNTMKLLLIYTLSRQAEIAPMLGRCSPGENYENANKSATVSKHGDVLTTGTLQTLSVTQNPHSLTEKALVIEAFVSNHITLNIFRQMCPSVWWSDELTSHIIQFRLTCHECKNRVNNNSIRSCLHIFFPLGHASRSERKLKRLVFSLSSLLLFLSQFVYRRYCYFIIFLSRIYIWKFT